MHCCTSACRAPQQEPEGPRLFYDKGWCRFDYDDDLAKWVRHALPSARAAVSAQANAKWLRCSGTWFAGVNVLPNSPAGEIGSSGPLLGSAVEFIEELGLTEFEWDSAQVSVCYPVAVTVSSSL